MIDGLNLTKWKIYQNGILRLVIDNVAVPANNAKGSLFYFDVARPMANFALGEQIQLVMPPGAPVYSCRVTGLSENPEDTQIIQIQASIVSVDMSGIK
jgi:hypothetical protein